jgi:hypothetical protein
LAQYLKVHQMLKHIVFSQKNAARKKKCMHMAETKETMVSLVLKLVKIRLHVAQSPIMKTYKALSGQPCTYIVP